MTPETHNHRLQVEGISCQHCVKTITQALQARDTNAAVTVQIGAGTVEVSTILPLSAVTDAITEEGYTVMPDRT